LVAGRSAPRHTCGCHLELAAVWFATDATTPHTAAATDSRLMLVHNKAAAATATPRHRITPHLWRQNTSPNIWRTSCYSVATGEPRLVKKATAAPHMVWQVWAAHQTSS